MSSVNNNRGQDSYLQTENVNGSPAAGDEIEQILEQYGLALATNGKQGTTKATSKRRIEALIVQAKIEELNIMIINWNDLSVNAIEERIAKLRTKLPTNEREGK